MGENNSKPQGPPPPTLTDILVQMKKGNEEGAALYLEMVQQKQSEAMQYLKVGTRLEIVAAQIKSKNKSMEMAQALNQFTPILMQSNQQMSLETMMQNMQSFTNAYDDLVVKGHIIDKTMENSLGDKNSMTNVDNMMNQLKAEVTYEMTGQTEPVLAPPQQ